jgi:hypothetical protein
MMARFKVLNPGRFKVLNPGRFKVLNPGMEMSHAGEVSAGPLGLQRRDLRRARRA